MIKWLKTEKTDSYESRTVSKCGRFEIKRCQFSSKVFVWLQIDGKPVLEHGDCGRDVNFQHIASAKAYCERIES